MSTSSTPLSLVTYEAGAGWCGGAAQNGSLVALETLDVPYPSIRSLLEAGPDALDDVLVRAAEALEAGGEGVLATASVRLGPPVLDPEKIICVGLNYADHAAEADVPTMDFPTVFAKFANSLIGPSDEIVIPRVSEQIDYEAELAAVIGRPCKEVSEEDALDYVAGYCAFNDVTARDLQRETSQWTAGKAVDTFGPMGPGLVPAAFVGDPQALDITTRVNGETLQQANTSTMIFSVATTIAYLSRFMTLNPGDVIATGTPAGVGFARTPPIFLRSGDVVEVEVQRVGTLRNTVVPAA